MSFTRFWYNTIFVSTFNWFCWNFKPILLTICALQDSASENKYRKQRKRPENTSFQISHITHLFTRYCNHNTLSNHFQSFSSEINLGDKPPNLIDKACNCKLSCGLYLLVQFHQKYRKCENSAKNQPDYVKITPQNSTDYVKSTY